MCVPLKFRGQVTGVIYVDNRIRTGLFTESERDLLAAFGNQAAIAIENARQFQEVTELKNLMENVFASMASGVITTATVSALNRMRVSTWPTPIDSSSTMSPGTS